MKKPMKQKPRVPLVEQVVNMTKWNKTSTWEALAARTVSEARENIAPCGKEPPEEKKSENT
jgi:hypothetical protein